MAAEMNGQWFIMLPPLAVGVFSLRLLNGGFSFKTGPCLLCEVEPLPEDKSGAEAKILYSKSSENSHFPPPKKKGSESSSNFQPMIFQKLCYSFREGSY